jgi:hypothetical protein
LLPHPTACVCAAAEPRTASAGIKPTKVAQRASQGLTAKIDGANECIRRRNPESGDFLPDLRSTKHETTGLTG